MFYKNSLKFFLFLPGVLFGQEVIPYPDNSPPAAQLELLGMPPPANLWNYPDYEAAFKVLDQIYAADKLSLPRNESAHSGDLFARMLAFENFDFLTASNLNLGKRIVAYEKYKSIPHHLLIYYVEDNRETERFSREVLECYLLETYVLSNGMQLYEELRRSLGKQTYGYLFKQGYRQIQFSLRNSMENLFTILESDYSRYNRKALSDFAHKFYFLFPKILEDDFYKSLKVRMKRLERKHPYAEVREIMGELRAEF